jgi:multidrug efflux pump subunit AcrA (membrane-fusion protein)
MKRKSIIAVILIAVLGAIGLFVYRDAFAKPAAAFRFVTVERGNLQQSVSATGRRSASARRSRDRFPRCWSTTTMW